MCLLKKKQMKKPGGRKEEENKSTHDSHVDGPEDPGKDIDEKKTSLPGGTSLFETQGRHRRERG